MGGSSDSLSYAHILVGALPDRFHQYCESLILSESARETKVARERDSASRKVKTHLNWLSTKSQWKDISCVLLYGLFGNAVQSVGFLGKLRKLAECMPTWPEAWAMLKIMKMTATESRKGGRQTQDGKWHTWMIDETLKQVRQGDDLDVEQSRKQSAPLEHLDDEEWDVVSIQDTSTSFAKRSDMDDSNAQPAKRRRKIYSMSQKQNSTVPHDDQSVSADESAGTPHGLEKVDRDDTSLGEDYDDMPLTSFTELEVFGKPRAYSAGEESRIDRQNSFEYERQSPGHPEQASSYKATQGDGNTSPANTHTNGNAIAPAPLETVSADNSQYGGLFPFNKCLNGDICVPALRHFNPKPETYYVASNYYITPERHGPWYGFEPEHHRVVVAVVHLRHRHHWCGVMINLDDRTIEILDPMHQDQNITETLSVVRDVMAKQTPSISPWELISPKAPLTFRQADQTSCGVFSIVYLLHRMFGQKVPDRLNTDLWRFIFIHLLNDSVDVDIGFPGDTMEQTADDAEAAKHEATSLVDLTAQLRSAICLIAAATSSAEKTSLKINQCTNYLASLKNHDLTDLPVFLIEEHKKLLKSAERSQRLLDQNHRFDICKALKRCEQHVIDVEKQVKVQAASALKSWNLMLEQRERAEEESIARLLREREKTKASKMHAQDLSKRFAEGSSTDLP